MTKQQTQIIKGIALLFMIWGHLFYNPEVTGRLFNLFHIEGQPLATILSRGMGPVNFFLVVGGYGLYYVYRRGRDAHHFSRIIKLYIHYWIILAIFMPLAVFFGGETFGFSARQVFLEITGLHASWDFPAWFLLPYSLLSLAYPWVFKVMDKMNCWVALVVTFLLSMSMAVLLHFYGATTINANPLLSVPVVFIEFLFPFVFGACACKYGLFDKLRSVTKKTDIPVFVVLVALICLFVCRSLFASSAVHPIYVTVFISLIVLLPTDHCKPMWRFLEVMGNHSMNMWLIHAFIYAYLLDGVIEQLRSPLLIFAVVIALTYLCSLGINRITSLVTKTK